MIVSSGGLSGLFVSGGNNQQAMISFNSLVMDIVSMNRAMKACGVEQNLADSWDAYYASVEAWAKQNSSTFLDYIPIYKIYKNWQLARTDLWSQVQEFRRKFVGFCDEYKKACPNNPLTFKCDPPQSASLTMFSYALLGLGVLAAGVLTYGAITKQSPRQIINRISSRKKS